VIITSLALRNFRCYCGQHDPIDLTPGQSANTILIFGENMKGKTSLLQAVRWCLYGYATDRQGRQIPIVDPETKEQLLSRDAEAAGDYTLAVDMRFRHEGSDYQLRREASAAGIPPSGSSFQITRELKTGARVFAQNLIDPWIQNMLSDDVSRFFLFDAEMLEDYEDLLKDPQQETQAVKAAIEKIIGLPSLRCYTGLAALAEASEQRQNAHLRKREKYDELLRDVDRLRNDIKGKSYDIKELEGSRPKLQQDVNEAELAVRQNADIEAKIRELGLLDQQTEDEETRLDAAEASVAELLRDCWWLPAVPQLERRLSKLREERTAATQNIEGLCRLKELERSRASKKCSLCEAPLDHSNLKHVEDEIVQLKLKHFDQEFSAFLETFRRADIYERFNSQEEMATLRFLQKTAVDSQCAISEYESRANDIRSSMADRAYGDYSQKLERWQRFGDQLKKLDEAVSALQKERDDLNSELSTKQGKLNRLPDADPSLSIETAAYHFLTEVFSTAVDLFRDGLRAKVGADASDIFRRLTTEKAYQGLRVDENYGLSLLDSAGNAVPGRSAGAEQVVALSLIGGLNRAAVREGPVVMDSNFARLDKGHRRNVLQFLPYLGPQVIVLVHSGEMDRETDLAEAGVQVARAYEIVRVSETRSKVVPEAI
jgi:DNA sulfur modification protein DndD